MLHRVNLCTGKPQSSRPLLEDGDGWDVGGSDAARAELVCDAAQVGRVRVSKLVADRHRLVVDVSPAVP